VLKEGEMSKVRWNDCDLEVRAKAVPRYFWTTASIDVYLDDLCILRTGGVLAVKGAQTTTFRQKTETHVLKLSWRSPQKGFSLPYELSIDERPVATAAVLPTNWPLYFMPLGAIALMGIALSLLANGMWH
jgi:hypothetical protein